MWYIIAIEVIKLAGAQEIETFMSAKTVVRHGPGVPDQNVYLDAAQALMHQLGISYVTPSRMDHLSLMFKSLMGFCGFK